MGVSEGGEAGPRRELRATGPLPFVVKSHPYDPTIMLLMGMWISLTKKPMKPMMANPIAVAMAIFWNSEIKESQF